MKKVYRKRFWFISLSLLISLFAVSMIVYYLKYRDNPYALFLNAVENTIVDMQQSHLLQGQGNTEFVMSLAGKEYVVKGELLLTGNQQAYFKINNLENIVDELIKNQPDLAEYKPAFGTVAAKLRDKWIEVIPKDLQALGVSVNDEQRRCANSWQNIQLSEKDQKQLEFLIKDNGFVSVGEQNKKQTDGGAEVQYSISINSSERKDLLQQILMSDAFAGIKGECQSLFSKELGEQQDIHLELWVGKETRRFHRALVRHVDRQADRYFQLDFQLKKQEVPQDVVSLSKLQSELQVIFP